MFPEGKKAMQFEDIPSARKYLGTGTELKYVFHSRGEIILRTDTRDSRSLSVLSGENPFFETKIRFRDGTPNEN